MRGRQWPHVWHSPLIALLGLGAAPAHATLLVRSDGAGVTVLDKNGLNDRVFITNVAVGFRIQNDNPDDIFKFDRQAGCFSTGQSDRVDCDDDRPKLNIGLFGGNDVLRLDGPNGGAVPSGAEAVVNAGNGNDDLTGHAGRDQFNGFGGVDKFKGNAGNDHLEGDEGADILTGGDGADSLLGEDGDDTIKAREVGTEAVRDSITCGAGNDYVEADLKDHPAVHLRGARCRCRRRDAPRTLPPRRGERAALAARPPAAALPARGRKHRLQGPPLAAAERAWRAPRAQALRDRGRSQQDRDPPGVTRQRADPAPPPAAGPADPRRARQRRVRPTRPQDPRALSAAEAQPPVIGRAATLAAVAGLAAAGPAQATVSVGVPGPADPRLIVTADGAADRLVLTVDKQASPVMHVISSSQPIVRAGSFCEAPVATSTGGATIRCRADDPTSLSVSLAGGDDSWRDDRVNEPGLPRDPVTVNAGSGVDSLVGSDVARETFIGDDGDDVARGGGGTDTLDGGNGNDRLDDEDGALNVDTLTGGPGNDTLTVHEGADTARGDAGSDEIFSVDDLGGGEFPSGDQLDGGSESDVLWLIRDRALSIRDDGFRATLFSDSLQEEVAVGFEGFRGTRGPDVINGAANSGTASPFYDGRGGPDTIVGTDHSEVIFGGDGSDRITARNGNDVVDAKEGEPVAAPDHLIDCGSGIGDQALIDLLDPEPVGCETFARSAIGEGPHLVLGTVRSARRGAWAVRVRCPRALGHPCRGTLKLGSTRRNAARGRGTRYRIRHGRRATLRVRLRGRARRRAFVRSVERGDVTGRKTTVGLRLLRRR